MKKLIPIVGVAAIIAAITGFIAMHRTKKVCADGVKKMAAHRFWCAAFS